ncbi:MAG TPA: carboxypeptidase regulatory-like domain-containing protein [Thermoanaerobaculia bacterium]|nr:carboxypeptidase regulatory-like domain-containing protein [Thermoanaerobaculia bacterium]
MVQTRIFRALLLLSVIALAIPLFAQQTGALHGRVLASDGSALPGVTVEARSNVLPQPRVTTSDNQGQYRLPALIPGTYTLTFTLSGMQTATRKTDVLLGQDQAIDVKLGVAAVSENITVTAEATLVNKESTAIQSGITQQEIHALPLVQNYSDLQKLVPGVQYSQDTVRGPSAGASGQDNVYLFDGANITMPLFGVLLAQPNVNDIAQVNITRGAASAIDFNRAGGFQIDSVSKSGTNEFTGTVSYELQNPNFVASQAGTQNLSFDNKKSWANVNLGGPIIKDRLFFYGSYYRPYAKRGNPSNLYGNLPNYTDTRNEEFGKLTFTPTQSWLLDGSYRNGHEIETSKTAFLTRTAPTAGTGFESKTRIGNFEGSKIISPKSYATFKLTSFAQPGFGRADRLASVTPSTALGTQLDINNLANIGQLSVPLLIGGNAAQNAFVQPYINKYGYICPQNPGTLGCTPGQLTGGGTVGFGLNSADNDSFGRKSGQVAYNTTLGLNLTHDLHFGYMRESSYEDLNRTSNGWGALSIPAGIGAAGTCPANACGAATPAFFVATFAAQGVGALPVIHSEYHAQNVEINDVMHWHNWSFNLGVVDSQDKLYGQGLKSANNFAGFVASPGTRYLMHVFEWKDMIQPRLGATWAYNGRDTVFASLSRYNPPANSDARAASWDRGLVQTVNAYFDAAGKLIGVSPVGSSSGKWWQAGIKPPEIKELTLGTARQINDAWSVKFYGRARKGDHYLEDTNNNARSAFNPPPGVPTGDYVPTLCNGSLATCGPNTIRGAIGSGSTYVIANLDGAFTKYYEATAESEYHTSKVSLHGTYTWMHYYGNFDQDYSTTSTSGTNDAAVFIGSSNIGDSAGRQLWDNKYGNLRGDRPMVAKLYGSYYLPWNASAGFVGVLQSGQKYQLESVLPYRALTGSTSDTDRNAEPAGSRHTPMQSDLDLNYTQTFPLVRGTNFQVSFDVFNVLNRQTGYNYADRVSSDLGIVCVQTSSVCSTAYQGATVPIPTTISDATLKTQVKGGTDFARNQYAVVAPYATSFLNPRRFQITARFQF